MRRETSQLKVDLLKPSFIVDTDLQHDIAQIMHVFLWLSEHDAHFCNGKSYCALTLCFLLVGNMFNNGQFLIWKNLCLFYVLDANKQVCVI